MKNIYLAVEAPEELGATYNYDKFLNTEEEALAEMSDVSRTLIDHMVKRGPIGDPAVGSELYRQYRGLYEVVAPNGWVGALYERIEGA